MNEKKKRYITTILLALIFAFSLAGISYYFPSHQETIFSPLPVTEQEGSPPEIIGSVISIINLPNITIKDDGTIDPQDAPIKTNEGTYTLMADIANQTLNIQRNNIIIDGASHKIQGMRNAAEGIILKDRNNVTLTNIEITQFWYGISVTSCSNIAIIENNIMNVSRAIMIDSGNNIIISNNTVADVGTAIEITATNGFSANNTITRNSISTVAQGITIDGSFNTITENNLVNIYIPIGVRGNHTTISKNNLVHGIDGIFLTGSYCTIYGNNIANFSESGMTINSGTNNNIYDNNISRNKYAIILRNFGDTWIIENNTFYHNNFTNNTQNIQVDSPSHQNYWDNDSEGNYWNDYKGIDENGDGIGDTAYIINTNNVDRYPLITPYEPMQQSNQMLWVHLGITGLIIFAAIVIGTTLINRRTKQNLV